MRKRRGRIQERATIMREALVIRLGLSHLSYSTAYAGLWPLVLGRSKQRMRLLRHCQAADAALPRVILIANNTAQPLLYVVGNCLLVGDSQRGEGRAPVGVLVTTPRQEVNSSHVHRRRVSNQYAIAHQLGSITQLRLDNAGARCGDVAIVIQYLGRAAGVPDHGEAANLGKPTVDVLHRRHSVFQDFLELISWNLRHDAHKIGEGRPAEDI